MKKAMKILNSMKTYKIYENQLKSNKINEHL